MTESVPPSKLRVFLCHSSGDKPQIRQLYGRLQTESWIQPWLDEEDLIPGQDWHEEIEKTVEQSHIILVCLSPDAITKEGFVQREIRVALNQADYMPEGTIYVIPLKLKPCEVPRRLNQWHWVNYFEERGHQNLLRGLRLRAEKLGIKLDSPQPTPIPVISLNKTDAPDTTTGKPVITSSPPQMPTASPRLTEQEQLVEELHDPVTTHERRRDIGDRLAEIGDTRRGVGVRDGLPDIEWLPVVPGGSITLGKRSFGVKPFFIARYLVTYDQYDAFVKAQDGFKNPLWWQDFPNGYRPQKLNEDYRKPGNYGRDNVSWYQSVAFVGWLNARLNGLKLSLPNGTALQVGQNAQVRLPTGWEWQWAAQGGNEGRKYPWGEWRDGYANTDEAGLGRAVAAGLYPPGAARSGALDMSGNLWEWCWNDYDLEKIVVPEFGQANRLIASNSNKYSTSAEVKELRGGSFDFDAYLAACAYRYDFPPNLDLYYVGFRVVVAAPTRASDL